MSVLGRGAELGGDEHGADFIAVQAGGMGLVVDPRPPHVHGRGAIEQVFLDRVPVQARDGGQPAGDRGTGAAGGFEVAAECSMSAQRAANRRSCRCRHRAVNWRRSRAYASQVMPE